MSHHYPTFNQDGEITFHDGITYHYKAGEKVTILSDFTTTKYFVLVDEGQTKGKMLYVDKKFIDAPE